MISPVLGIAFLPGADFIGPDLRVLLCPLLTLLTYNAVALPFRVFGVARGYASAARPGALLKSLRLAEWNHAVARAGALGYGALLALVALSLDLGSGRWGADGRSRVASLTPLVLARMHRYALRRASSAARYRPSPHRRQLPVQHLTAPPQHEPLSRADARDVQDDGVRRAVRDDDLHVPQRGEHALAMLALRGRPTT